MEMAPKVRGVLTVVPAKVTPPGKTYPLANLDHMMASHQNRIVYYYARAPGAGTTTAQYIAELQASLSKTLSTYPALCGRLVRREDDGNWDILCNDSGVRVCEASVPVTLQHWLQHAGRQDELKLCFYEPLGPDPYICALFFIQLTEFSCGALAIGLSCSHMMGDPSCATLVMKAWGETHRRAQLMHPPFFHPPGLRARPGRRDCTIATDYYAATFKYQPTVLAPTYATATFKFSDDSVQRCMDAVVADGFESPKPFPVLAALFWGACCRAKKGYSGHHDSSTTTTTTASLSLCTEFRKITVSPLPHGFFGNAVHFSEVSAPLADVADAGDDEFDFSRGARLIQDDVARLEREELRSVVEWLEGQKSADGTLPPAAFFYGPQLTAVNGENFFSYFAVFEGEQRPMHVSYHVEPAHGEGLIFVSPALEDGLARTVAVTLPGQQVCAVVDDPVVRRFAPSIMLYRHAKNA